MRARDPPAAAGRARARRAMHLACGGVLSTANEIDQMHRDAAQANAFAANAAALRQNDYISAPAPRDSVLKRSPAAATSNRALEGSHPPRHGHQ